MALYLDSAYVAKCYLNEPDAAAVRTLARTDSDLRSSAWCIGELACIFHRHVREGALSRRQARALAKLFREDLENGVWSLVPVSSALLLKVEDAIARLRKTVYVRAGDAIHLVSARETGVRDVWTNDRHLLAAAGRFGLRGRSA